MHGVAALFVEVDDDFGVGVRAEDVAARDQVASQLAVVVDLAVEDELDRAVLVGHRLVRGGAEVDDAQPAEAEPGAPVGRHERSRVVGPAVRDARRASRRARRG